jgi:hypothetical protein
MPIKDLAGIGKTVKTVSDAVSGAVSMLYKPTAIRREGRARNEVAAHKLIIMAEAEVEAALIKQEGNFALEERVRQRFVFEQSTQQDCLDRISSKALVRSKDHPRRKGRKISEHWLYRLMINSKDVTDDEIQDIFAQLIVEQGSEGRGTISYMTLDALRLFEPRHAVHFKAFCQLYYLFGSVVFGMRDLASGRWTGDEEFNELGELGMLHEASISSDSKLRMRDFSIERAVSAEHGAMRSIFAASSHLSLRGIELSKVLYPDVANQYWHGLRKNLSRSKYERIMSAFIADEVQDACFRDVLGVLTEGDDTEFAVMVHPWASGWEKKHAVLKFNGGWTVGTKPPAQFYVPPYLRRFLDEHRG